MQPRISPAEPCGSQLADGSPHLGKLNSLISTLAKLKRDVAPQHRYKKKKTRKGQNVMAAAEAESRPVRILNKMDCTVAWRSKKRSHYCIFLWLHFADLSHLA